MTTTEVEKSQTDQLFSQEEVCENKKRMWRRDTFWLHQEFKTGSGDGKIIPLGMEFNIIMYHVYSTRVRTTVTGVPVRSFDDRSLLTSEYY